MSYKIDFLPEGIILLNKELATGLHPRLEKELQDCNHKEWEIRLAIIAKYCDIMLDDIYAKEDINHLCAVLSGRLIVLRELPAAQNILPFH